MFNEHSALVEELLDRIRLNGALTSGDVAPREAIDWFWRPTNQVKPSSNSSARLQPRKVPSGFYSALTVIGTLVARSAVFAVSATVMV